MVDLNNNGVPDDLEYKDTRGTLIGYGPAPVPHLDRTGNALDDDERHAADGVVGSPAQGNGLQNSHLVDDGITTETAGTQSASTLGRKDSVRKGRSAPKAQGPGARVGADK